MLLWEHLVGTSAVFCGTLENAHTSWCLDLGPGTSGRSNAISCAAFARHKYDVRSVMHPRANAIAPFCTVSLHTAVPRVKSCLDRQVFVSISDCLASLKCAFH